MVSERCGFGLMAWALAGSLLVSTAIYFARLDLEDLRPLITLRFSDTQWVDPATLAQWMESDSAPILLDARTAAEYAESHLPGAIRVDRRELDLDALSIPASTPVVVYCSVGYRSAAVIETLTKQGASNLYNLEGGVFRWANEGRPIYRDGEPSTKVHPFARGWGRFLNEELRAPLGAQR